MPCPEFLDTFEWQWELQRQNQRMAPDDSGVGVPFQEGWLSIDDVSESTDIAKLTELLDRGDAEAIVLAWARSLASFDPELKRGV